MKFFICLLITALLISPETKGQQADSLKVSAEYINAPLVSLVMGN